MKLMYKDIELGQINDIQSDMGREEGKFILASSLADDGSLLQKQLLKWISISAKLREYEYSLADDIPAEEYDNDPKLNMFWNELDGIPDFARHDNWYLLHESSGKTERISFSEFCYGKAYWSIHASTLKSIENSNLIFGLNDKQFNFLILISAILLALAVWFFRA